MNNIGYEDKVRTAGSLRGLDQAYDLPAASQGCEAKKLSKRPALEVALDSLHGEIDRCSDRLAELEERIRVVMLPEAAASTVGNDAAVPATSAAVSTVLSATYRLAVLRRRMEDYLNRLET